MRKITSLLMLLCMFVGTAWAQPEAGKAYFLKDKCGTYLDIHNLGKEANDQSKNQLATMSADPQDLYITQIEEGDKIYWQIHTTAEGGNYLKQHPSERRWNTWVSEGTGDFKWEVEEFVESDITYYKLKNISGVENGYLGTSSHAAGESLYTNGDALKLQLIEKIEGFYVVVLPEGYVLIYGGEEYENGDMLRPEGELSTEDLTIKSPVGYSATVSIDAENKKITISIQIDLTAFVDGTKWMFLNKQHQTYMGVYFEGGELDNDPAPTSHKLSSTKNSYSYKNCIELKAATYGEGEEAIECFQLYSPYYGWYVGKIEARNGPVNMVATQETAGYYAIETVGTGIAFKCLNKTTSEEYSYLHQVDWGGYAVVDWNKEADASQWSVQIVTDEKEISWFASMSDEVAKTKEKILKYTIGTAPGQYQGKTQDELTYAANNIVIPETGTITEKIKSLVYCMYVNASVVDGLTLNMPTAGFYRIKSLNGNDANKAGKYWQIKDDASAMEAGADKTINSIVYVKSNADKYNIVSYASGLYLNKYKDVDPVGTEAKAWSFVENTSVIGSYALYASADPHPAYCLSDWSGITYGQKDANAAWTFEPVEALPVEVSAAGYATLYAPVALTLADGVEAYYVSAKSATSATMTQVTGVIPANTAVVLKAAKGTYNLAVASEAEAIGGNLLSGTLGSEFVAADAYVLSKQEEGIGFYKAELNISTNTENDGAEGEEGDTYEAFLNNGFKAYLPASAVPTSARFLSFDFGTETAIDELKGENGKVKTAIYDLSGRRVQKAQKGLYIVNGVKVIK